MNKHEYLINGKCFYNIVSTKREFSSIWALLRDNNNNYIVANGLNAKLKYEDKYIRTFSGDWEHGHYFMEDEKNATRFFNSINTTPDFY